MRRRHCRRDLPNAPCISLRSKRFHLVSEQRKTGFGRARNEMRAKKCKRGEREGNEGKVRVRVSSPPRLRSFTCAIFLAVFDSRSLFFAPKPHGKACYAG